MPAEPVPPADVNPLSLRDLLAAIMSSVVSALPVMLVAGLAIQIETSLRFGPAELGAMVSLYFLCAAIASVPLSRLAGAIGSMRTMRWGCIVMAVLLVVLAGTVRSLSSLAIVTAVAGFVSAGIQPATNQFLVRRIPSRHYGLAFGIKQAAVPVALLLGGLSVPAIALTIGWRWAFVAAAIFATVASLVLPRSSSNLASYRARRPTGHLDSAARRSLTWLACGFAAGVAAANALSAFIVSAAVDSGHSETTAGLFAVVGGILAAVTRVIVGWRADHSSRTHLDVVVWMLVIGAVGYVLLAISASHLPVLLLVGVLVAFSTGWGWNGLFNLAVSTTYIQHAAEASGIMSVGGRLGGVIGPAAFGFVVAHSSYVYGWILATVSALIGAAIIFSHRKHLNRAG